MNLFEQKNGCMPDNKALSVEFAKKPELKKYMKKVMPFVQMAKEKVEKHGIQAIDLTTEFDEVDVINKNIDYITATLDVCITLPLSNLNREVAGTTDLFVYADFFPVGGTEYSLHR